MTERCIVEVLALQEQSETFNDLTIEQLLYACVAAVGVKEALYTLMNTDWAAYCPNAVEKHDN